MMWRPISEAPKDGTEILADDDRCSLGFSQVVYWTAEPVPGWEVSDADIIYPEGFFTRFIFMHELYGLS